MQYIGQRSGFLSTVAVVAVLMGGSASAQALRDATPPAEFPPTSFTGNQYVDSRGCVYVRAGIGGAVEWVPRVTREREQLCGFQPTQVAGATTTAPAVNAPNPLDTPVAGLAPREETTAPVIAATPPVARPAPEPNPAPVAAAAPDPQPTQSPAPVVAAAPQPSTVIPAPERTLPTSTANAINPLTGRPVGAATPEAVQTAAPTPRVVTPPAPVVEPRVLTRAEACEGLFGVQPNLIGQRSGQPIDCGPAPEAPVIAQAPAPEPAAEPAQQTLRMTRSQACADMAATGRRFINAATGQPVECPPQSAGTPTVPTLFAGLRRDLGRPQQGYTNPLDSAPGATASTANRPQMAGRSPAPYSNPLDAPPGSVFASNDVGQSSGCAFGDISFGSPSSGISLRCGPQEQSPSGVGRPVTAPETVTRARTSTTGHGFFAELLNQDPPPYSNPPQGTPITNNRPPAGYTRAWEDGRLNPNRGLPNHATTTTYAREPIQQAQPAARVSTRVAPQTTTPQRAEQLSGHRYVQVATFSNRADAQAIAQSLRARGLPMRIGVYERNGQQMRIVLAGPFANDSQLRSALGTARTAGFSGAFTRQ